MFFVNADELRAALADEFGMTEQEARQEVENIPGEFLFDELANDESLAALVAAIDAWEE
jgi:hypothetical protein